MKKYISDVIADDYHTWTAGNIIFLTAPTGTGKTFFILNRLLPFCASCSYRLLYFVNRKILKEQLNREVEKLNPSISAFIEIVTYQSLEDAIRNNDQRLQRWMNCFVAVVDEAHYFCSDILFNTSAQLSYNWIRDNFENKIRIYVSATMENLCQYMKDRGDLDPSARLLQRTPFYGYILNIFKRPIMGIQPRFEPKIYNVNSLYKDIDINILRDYMGIVDIIESAPNSEKWIVFVDSINMGKDLEKNLKKKWDEKVLFLSSGYRNDQLELEEIRVITTQQRQSMKVLICTSVMDNGISLKDEELRNIVIIADTKEEFLQMLGRKRKEENQKMKLFLVNKSREEINRRKTYIEALRTSAKNFATQIIQCENEIRYRKGCLNDAGCLQSEKNYLEYQHRNLLKKILVDKDTSVIKYTFPFDKYMIVSLLALHQIEYLYNYYTELLRLYDEYGDYALAYKQLEWMDYSKQEAEGIINSETRTTREKNIAKVVNLFEEIEGKEFSAEEFKAKYEENGIRMQIKQLMDSCSDSFLSQMENGKEKINSRDSIRKNKVNKKGSTLSDDVVSWLREVCNIPYDIKRKKGSDGKMINKLIKVEE